MHTLQNDAKPVSQAIPSLSPHKQSTQQSLFLAPRFSLSMLRLPCLGEWWMELKRSIRKNPGKGNTVVVNWKSLPLHLFVPCCCNKSKKDFPRGRGNFNSTHLHLPPYKNQPASPIATPPSSHHRFSPPFSLTHRWGEKRKRFHYFRRKGGEDKRLLPLLPGPGSVLLPFLPPMAPRWAPPAGLVLLMLLLTPTAVRGDKPLRGGPSGAGAEPEASSAVFPLYGDVYPHGCIPPSFSPPSLCFLPHGAIRFRPFPFAWLQEPRGTNQLIATFGPICNSIAPFSLKHQYSVVFFISIMMSLMCKIKFPWQKKKWSFSFSSQLVLRGHEHRQPAEAILPGRRHRQRPHLAAVRRALHQLQQGTVPSPSPSVASLPLDSGGHTSADYFQSRCRCYFKVHCGGSWHYFGTKFLPWLTSL